jgi:hypothetical protein
LLRFNQSAESANENNQLSAAALVGGSADRFDRIDVVGMLSPESSGFFVREELPGLDLWRPVCVNDDGCDFPELTVFLDCVPDSDWHSSIPRAARESVKRAAIAQQR